MAPIAPKTKKNGPQATAAALSDPSCCHLVLNITNGPTLNDRNRYRNIAHSGSVLRYFWMLFIHLFILPDEIHLHHDGLGIGNGM